MNITGTYFLHEIGQKKNQEDYIWPVGGKPSPDERVFIVCDGVGGSENGEIASRIISEFVAKRAKDFSPEEMSVSRINDLLTEARAALMDYAGKNSLNGDMATTFSMLIIYPEKAFIAWCGDTRVYHVRAGRILFKTEDHSLVNALKREGEITEEEARQHPQKNIILRAIKADGSSIAAEAQWIEDIQSGDFFLLCTDGVLENVSDEIIQFLLSQKDIEKKDIARSFDEYCYGKTRDNYSMYLIRLGLKEDPLYPHSASKKWVWVFGVAVLIFVLLTVYFTGKNSRNNRQEQKDSVNHALIQSGKRDSLPYLEIVSDEADSGAVDSTVHPPAGTRGENETDSSGKK